MATKKEMNKKFYTAKGIDALVTRCKSFIELFNKNEFPINNMMLGFGAFEISTKEECWSRIKELSNLTGFQCKITKINDGEIKETIECQ